MTKQLEALLRQIQKIRVQDITPLDQDITLKVLAADTRWKPTTPSIRLRPLFEYTGPVNLLRTGPVGYRFISPHENAFKLWISISKGWSIKADEHGVNCLAAAVDNYTSERPVEARLYVAD